MYCLMRVGGELKQMEELDRGELRGRVSFFRKTSLMVVLISGLLISARAGMAQTTEPPPAPQASGQNSYTPNFGYKVADTKQGDLSISIYTYARYLNQTGLSSTYVDAFANTKGVQQRQDIQLNKLQIKFLGWIMSPKLRYFIYAWTSNANQGNGAQVVLAGNLNYSFSKYISLSAGINGLPGT